MKKIVFLTFVLSGLSAQAITLKCQQSVDEPNSQIMVESVGESQLLGENRVSCHNKTDSTEKVGMLIRGVGVGLRYTEKESFTVRCPKAERVNDLIYYQNGFSGGKISLGIIAGASVGVFKSEAQSELGSCYLFGSSFKSIGAGITGASLTFWNID